MRYLFFANTPAHVHLYKHSVDELRERGHDVLVLARDYGCTMDLVEWYGLPHRVYGHCDTTKGSLLSSVPKHYWRMLRHARRFDPDLIFGIGAYAAHTGAVVRSPTILITDSEPTGLDHAVSTPFARAVLTPETFRKDLGDDHYVFSGFKESAYLHPDVYEVDSDVRRQLGVDEGEAYAIVRLNAFGSHHDVGRDGFTGDRRRRLIECLSEHVTVFVSDEGGDFDFEDLPAQPFDLHPTRLHDALAEARLLVADTQTMVTEAALLGTPAIRSNSFVGDSDMGNFVELERAGLVENIADFEDVIDRARALLERDDLDAAWRRKRDEFVADKIDLTELIVDVAFDGGRVAGHPDVRAFGQPVESAAPQPRAADDD